MTHDSSPAQELHEKLTDRFSDRPFRYEDASARFEDEFDNFQQTFASVVQSNNYTHDSVDDYPLLTKLSDEELQDAIVGLRNYLDAEDDWFIHTGFRHGGDLDAYVDDVPELTDDTLNQLYDHGLLYQGGSISIVTDEGWWAIYTASGEDVYLTREAHLSTDKEAIEELQGWLPNL